jgi:hypothetical protein
MADSRRLWIFMGVAFLAAVALAAVILTMNGITTEGVGRAIRLTARFSYLLFWCAYAGSSLVVLFGPRFRTLARRGREFGLAFASAHTVHLGLVIWLYQLSPEPPISNQLAVFFGIGILWMYLLALFSIGQMSALIGNMAWRRLRFIGLEYIQIAFLKDFVPYSLHGKAGLILYLPFAILGIIGTCCRLLIWSRKRLLTPKHPSSRKREPQFCHRKDITVSNQSLT